MGWGSGLEPSWVCGNALNNPLGASNRCASTQIIPRSPLSKEAAIPPCLRMRKTCGLNTKPQSLTSKNGGKPSPYGAALLGPPPPHRHSPPVPCSRVPNENPSHSCSSLLFMNPTETWLGMTTVDTVCARASQAKHDFQLNKTMNMRCRSPEQHKSTGTTNSRTGNSTSMSWCTTSSPSFSSVRRREGEGALWFPVLSLSCGSMCCRLSHRPAKARGLACGGVTRMTWDCLLFAGTRGLAWGGEGACDAATRHHLYPA